MESSQTQSVCEDDCEIKGIIDWIIKQITTTRTHEDLDEQNPNPPKLLINVFQEDKDLVKDIAANYKKNATKSTYISTGDKLCSEQKTLFVQALNLAFCHKSSVVSSNEESSQVKSDIKFEKTDIISPGYSDFDMTKKTDTVHFNSPVALVYEYTVSESSDAGSTQPLSDVESEDDIKECLKLDKYPLQKDKKFVEEKTASLDDESHDAKTELIPDHDNCAVEEVSQKETCSTSDKKKSFKGNAVEEETDFQNKYTEVSRRTLTKDLELDQGSETIVTNTENLAVEYHIIDTSHSRNEEINLSSNTGDSLNSFSARPVNINVDLITLPAKQEYNNIEQANLACSSTNTDHSESIKDENIGEKISAVDAGGLIELSQKEKFQNHNTPVTEVFQKAQFPSSDRSPDLFLEMEAFHATDHFDLRTKETKRKEKVEEENGAIEMALGEMIEVSDSSSKAMINQEIRFGRNKIIMMEEVQDMLEEEKEMTDLNEITDENIDTNQKSSVCCSYKVLEEVCYKDNIPTDNLEVCSSIRKRKLFHCNSEENNPSAKALKFEEDGTCGLNQQPLDLKVLARQALDKTEENCIWSKSDPTIVECLWPVRKTRVLEEHTLLLNQATSNHTVTSGIILDNVNYNDVPANTMSVQTTEYPGFISATEHLSQTSQTSQGSSTGFICDGNVQETGELTSSQTSVKSIYYINTLQQNFVKMNSETAGEDEMNCGDNDQHMTNSQKETMRHPVTEAKLDLSDLDNYIDRSIDQIVPDEDTNTADIENRDTEYSTGEEDKLYSCDIDMCDEKDRPVCNKVEKKGTDDDVIQTGCFRWRYVPSCDLENSAAPPSDLDVENQVVRIIPLKTCGKPIRLGLSKRQSLVHLHKLK